MSCESSQWKMQLRSSEETQAAAWHVRRQKRRVLEVSRTSRRWGIRRRLAQGQPSCWHHEEAPLASGGELCQSRTRRRARGQVDTVRPAAPAPYLPCAVPWAAAKGRAAPRGERDSTKGASVWGGEAGAAGSSGGRRGGGRGGSPGHGVSPAWMPPTQTAGSGGKQGTSHRKPRTPRENKQNRNGIQHAARLHVNSAGAAPNPRRSFPRRTLL